MVGVSKTQQQRAFPINTLFGEWGEGSETGLSLRSISHHVLKRVEVENSSHTYGSPSRRTGWWNVMTEQRRGFGGRVGGLKRRKELRQPNYVQTGFGKLMEFFWIKGTPKRRVPMYQNIRTHLVHDAYQRRWLVMWYWKGVQYFKAFSFQNKPLEFVSKFTHILFLNSDTFVCCDSIRLEEMKIDN